METYKFGSFHYFTVGTICKIVSLQTRKQLVGHSMTVLGPPQKMKCEDGRTVIAYMSNIFDKDSRMHFEADCLELVSFPVHLEQKARDFVMELCKPLSEFDEVFQNRILSGN